MELEPEGVVPPATDQQDGRDATIQAIEAMIDEDRLEEAIAEIEKLRASGRGNALDLAFLAGDAYLGMLRCREAEQEFRRVLSHDPDCPASRCWLAMALFLQWRFDEAEQAVLAARELPDAIPDVYAVHGAILERRERWEEADACFERAAAAAPDKYPLPVRMSRSEFDREVRNAARKLPRQFRRALDRVPVVVQDVPAEDLRTDEGGSAGSEPAEVGPDILGLFVGVPLPETGELDITNLRPNTIYLFQRNLERAAKGRADLVEQIEITLYHELGHYLGFEEEDMGGLGLE